MYNTNPYAYANPYTTYGQQQGQSATPYYANAYNPIANNEARTQNILNSNPHLQQQYAPNPAALRGRPVSNMDEAKAAQIDFDGSIHVFTDIANGRIYTKRISEKGTADFCVYVLQPVETAEPTVAKPIPQADLTGLIEAHTLDLKDRITQLENRLEKLGGIGHAEFNATAQPVTKQRQPNGIITATGSI